MVHQYRPNFPHRFNADGSYDSICTLCHLTVATAKTEAHLLQHERSHKCDPVRLYQVSQYAQGPAQPQSRNSAAGLLGIDNLRGISTGG
jgi:hypothetical protein